jgi:hypothetical protein
MSFPALGLETRTRAWPKEIHYLRHAPPPPRLHVEQGQKGQNAKALPPDLSGEQGQKGQNVRL